MGAEEIIKLFNNNVEADVEKQLSNHVVFQEAIRITMEMNNSYHSENLSLDNIGNKLPSDSDRDNDIEDTQHNNSDKLHSNPQKTNILIVYFSTMGTKQHDPLQNMLLIF